MVLAQKQTLKPMELNRRPREKSMQRQSTKEPRSYAGEKIASLRNGAGKTGYLQEED
jgi:hypothetical protein